MSFRNAAIFVSLTVLATAALAACSSQVATTPVPTRDPLTQIATVETSPTVGPIQPIPSMAIETGGKLYPGARASYCWPVEATGPSLVEVCAEAIAWSNIESETPVGESEEVTVHFDAEQPPTKATAYLFAEPLGSAIEMIELEPGLTSNLPLALPPGNMLLRLSGFWREGQVDYEFELLRVPEGDGLIAECVVTEADPRPLTFVPEDERTPTGFDGRNGATCRFSKLVGRVEVTLDSEAIGLHGETFLIEPPSYELAFPLADDIPSESTLELLPVGAYERVVIVVAEDGDRWNVNEHVGSALDTVTVVKKAVTDREQLIRVVLEWALVDKNLPDYGLLPDPTDVLISLEGRLADELPTLPGVTLTALTEAELQTKADAEGSLLRLSLENLVIAGDTAEIWVGNWWVSSSTETRQFLSGGFCELQLRKTGDQWAIVNSICALA